MSFSYETRVLIYIMAKCRKWYNRNTNGKLSIDLVKHFRNRKS